MSPDLATTVGVRVSRLNLYFLLVFVLTIMLGLQFLGVLLMGSLVIIPAATSRNLTKSLNSALTCSLVIACISVTLGFFLSITFGSSLGPTIISVAAAIFFLSLFARNIRGR